MGNPAIRFHGVSLHYTGTGRPGLKRTLFDLVTLRRHDTDEGHWALQGISFSIERGESVGIIGRNGSGKSTTLGLIAQVLVPTRGSVSINGFTVPLLQLGAGFHQDLSGGENVVLNAVLLGFTRREALNLVPSIADFSGLGARLDDPLRTYSTGMRARLGFAVAAHVEPEILLVDEILAVGDAGFRDRCIAAIKRLNGSGTTLVYVGHARPAVEMLCGRSMLLHNGRLEYDGSTEETFRRYFKLLEADPGGCG